MAEQVSSSQAPYPIDRLKLLHVITGLGTGGAEMMLLKLLGSLDRRRFDSRVVSLRSGGPLKSELEKIGIPVLEIGFQIRRPSPYGIGRIVKELMQWRPNLIQGWMYHGNLVASVLAKLFSYKVPTVWNIRQSLYDIRFEKPLTAAIIRLGAPLSRHPARVLFNAQISAHQHEAIGYRTERTMVLPNGFDCKRFRPNPQFHQEVRQTLGLSNETILVGQIGRFHPVKDHHSFLKAAAATLAVFPETHFLLAGTNVDTANQTLQNWVAELGLAERVHLLGERKDVECLNAALDVACSSSIAEGFPNVIGEAMASGVPCVVTDVGDSALLVGDSGFVVPPHDPDKLGRSLCELLSMPPSQRQELGKAARRRIKEHYSIEEVSRLYEVLYEEIVSNVS